VDWSLTHALNTFFAHHDALEDPVVAYANTAELLFAALLAVLFVLVGGHRRTAARRAAVAAGLSCGLALLVAQVLSRVVDRPRPFVARPDDVHLFTRHVADPGFPSDHATAAFAIAIAILLRNRPWGALVTVFAAILAVARVAMGVHYPTDVLGGAAIGSLCALVLYLPPVRERLHWLADFAGAIWDGAVRAVGLRLGVAGR
jgi:undecaprenyl-diphosphatase